MKERPFFVVGGTIEPDIPTYIVRTADEHLFQAVLAGEYCNVLAARQLGKSSLMTRTAKRLQAEGVQTVIIDLTTIGSTAESNQWHYSLITLLTNQLNLTIEPSQWWGEREQQTATQRFADFLHDVILAQTEGQIVIFIDEIDTTLNLPFTDDFFAVIRAAYNARPRIADYKRLVFVLLGVARASNLIKDPSRTPYNVGQTIDLSDFSLEEAKLFLLGLPGDSAATQAILKQLLYWTDGHPYLTQKMCVAIAADGRSQWTDVEVSQLVHTLFIADEARKENNIQHINDRIRADKDVDRLLRLYKRILSGQSIRDEGLDPLQSQLKLAGLVKTTAQGTLTVRNRIYETVFDKNWIRKTTPLITTRRITTAAIVVIIFSLFIIGFALYRQQNNAQIQAELFREQFQTTGSVTVRLTSLASILQLGAEFADEGRRLFLTLPSDEQTALFADLANPEQVGSDLQIVVRGVYDGLDNNDRDNETLKAMLVALQKVEEFFPDSVDLASEIEAWQNGRSHYETGEYEEAVQAYDMAVNYNGENTAVRYDRALAHIQLEQYELALIDLDKMAHLNPQARERAIMLIEANDALNSYYASNREKYLALDMGN